MKAEALWPTSLIERSGVARALKAAAGLSAKPDVRAEVPQLTQETMVSLRRVKGANAKGASRTNAIEAQAMVDEVVKRLGSVAPLPASAWSLSGRVS